MIEYINRGGRTDLPCRRIPTSKCRDSPFQKVELNFSRFECGLHLVVTCFRRIESGKGQPSHCCEKTYYRPPVYWPRLRSPVTGRVHIILSLMWETHFTSGFLSQNSVSQSHHEKTCQTNSNWGAFHNPPDRSSSNHWYYKNQGKVEKLLNQRRRRRQNN